MPCWGTLIPKGLSSPPPPRMTINSKQTMIGRCRYAIPILIYPGRCSRYFPRLQWDSTWLRSDGVTFTSLPKALVTLTIAVVHLQADNFTSIKWNKQAFDMLVLEKDHKKLLRTVISSREADRPFEADFIQGKGSGLTILLHGIPGVGKTFTAESYVVPAPSQAIETSDEKCSIAEAMEKPLYHLTTGDIGTEPEEAETHLRSAFLLAQTWGSSRFITC